MCTDFEDDFLKLGLVRRWPSSNAKKWSISKLAHLALKPRTAAIIAIGSAVRSAHHSGSDVDFLVISDAPVPLDSLRPIDVDLRIFRTAEVDEKVRECDDLLGWALRFGVAIFDRNNYWAGLRAKWIDQLPFPSPELSIRRALRFEKLAQELMSIGDLDAALEQVTAMLTHRSRASLIQAGVYPASRPELPGQLREIGEHGLAQSLERALQHRQIDHALLESIERGVVEDTRSRMVSGRAEAGISPEQPKSRGIQVRSLHRHR